MTVTFSVTIDDHTADQLRGLLAQSDDDAPNLPANRTLEALTEQLLVAWADGWRRPGSWERSMLVPMGHA